MIWVKITVRVPGGIIYENIFESQYSVQEWITAFDDALLAGQTLSLPHRSAPGAVTLFGPKIIENTFADIEEVPPPNPGRPPRAEEMHADGGGIIRATA